MANATFVFKTAPCEGGVQEIKADIYYAQTDEQVTKPLAVYFHGGNFTVGSRALLPSAHREKLLALGFVVVSPDYRLSPTISADEGAVADSLDAYKWAHSELPALLKQKGVNLDSSKIVALGHSCGGTLALLTASAFPKPLAIADFFGFKYLDDPFYHTPLAAMSKLPPFDQDFTAKIYTDVPPPTGTPPPFGPNGPDFSKYRVAWLFDNMRMGTFFRQLVHDGDLHKIDPAPLFDQPDFPPTVFVHGSADTGVDVKFSQKAYEHLHRNGIATKLLIQEGGAHGFDSTAKPGDKEFDLVSQALDFLKGYI